jgi:hypothetical protein
MVELSNKRYRSVLLLHWSCAFFGFIGVALFLVSLHWSCTFLVSVFGLYLMAQEHFNGGWVAPELKPPLAGS